MDKYAKVFIPSPYDFSRTIRYPQCECCHQEIRPDWCGLTETYTVNGKTMCRRCYNLNYGMVFKGVNYERFKV